MSTVEMPPPLPLPVERLPPPGFRLPTIVVVIGCVGMTMLPLLALMQNAYPPATYFLAAVFFPMVLDRVLRHALGYRWGWQLLLMAVFSGTAVGIGAISSRPGFDAVYAKVFTGPTPATVQGIEGRIYWLDGQNFTLYFKTDAATVGQLTKGWKDAVDPSASTAQKWSYCMMMATNEWRTSPPPTTLTNPQTFQLQRPQDSGENVVTTLVYEPATGEVWVIAWGG